MNLIFRILICAVLSSLSSAVISQNCDIRQQLKDLDSLNRVGSFNEALNLVSESLKCPSMTGNEKIALYVWKYRLERNRLKTRRAGKAIDSAFLLYNISDQIPSAEHSMYLAESYALRGRSEDVQPLLLALDLTEDDSLMRSYYEARLNLIRHFAMDGDQFPAERTALLYDALAILENLDVAKSVEIDPYYLGNTLRALGNLNRTNGDLEQSASFYSRELELYSKLYPEDHFDISICNYNLGGVFYEKLEFGKALDHFLSAHKVWSKVYDTESFRMRTLNEAIGDMYWELEDYESALNYFNAAIDTEKKINNDLSELSIASADSLLASGNYGAALDYYREAVKWRENVYGKDHKLTGACKNFEGRALRSAGDIPGALDAYQQAINILVNDMDDPSWYTNPVPGAEVKSPQYLLEALTGKGSLLKQRYIDQGDLNDLKAALETFERAISVVDELKNQQTLEGAKTFWSEKTLPLIEESIETAFLIHEQTGEIGALEKAFEFSERSKALLLLASLYGREISDFSEVPVAVIEKEKELKQAITEYEGRLEGEQKRCADVREKMLKLYSEKLTSLKTEYDAFINQVALEHPNYHQLKFESQTTDLKELRAELLDQETMMISYFFGIHNLYIFTITEERMQLRRLSNLTEIETSVSSLFSNLTDNAGLLSDPQGSYANFVTVSRNLYKQLLSEELARNIYQCPDHYPGRSFIVHTL